MISNKEFIEQAKLTIQKSNKNIVVKIDYKNKKIIIYPDPWRNRTWENEKL